MENRSREKLPPVSGTRRSRPRAKLARSWLLAVALAFGLAHAADVNAVLLQGRLEAPALVTGTGFRSIGLINHGNESAEFRVYRLLSDASAADLLEANAALDEAVAANDDRVPGIRTLTESAEALSGLTVSAHDDEEMLVDLRSGTYVIVATAGDEAPVHASFRVVGGADDVDAPQVPNAVTFSDFAFDFPSQVDEGDILWEVNNTGAQPHDAELFRLLPGKTVADLQAYLNGDGGDAAPYDKTATIEFVSAGATVFVPVDLSAGRWVALCSVPNMDDAQMTHAMEGMIAEFRVD